MITPRPDEVLRFDSWKVYLRRDCIRHEKLEAYNLLGDYILQLLYESGVAPSVEAVSADPECGRAA